MRRLIVPGFCELGRALQSGTILFNCTVVGAQPAKRTVLLRLLGEILVSPTHAFSPSWIPPGPEHAHVPERQAQSRQRADQAIVIVDTFLSGAKMSRPFAYYKLPHMKAKGLDILSSQQKFAFLASYSLPVITMNNPIFSEKVPQRSL